MHKLDGPRLKIRRAEREISRLRSLEDRIRRSGDYQIVPAELNPKTGKRVYRACVRKSPSLDWGVWIGEISHNLRSALDGLVWQLALLETDTPTDGTQFPIFLVGRTIRRKPKGGGKIPHFDCDGRRYLRSLRQEHQAIIEALQPYKRGAGGRENLLWQLHEINRVDKHRLLQVVGLMPSMIGWSHWGTTVDEPTDIVWSPRFRRDFAILHDRAKILEAGSDVHVNPNLEVHISFAEGCDAVKGFPVCATLARIAEQVSGIVEGFGPEFA